MKKTTLLMLTLMLSVFAFAQEIQQIPQPGLKKKLNSHQQVLQAKRVGELTQANAAQFKFNKPVLPQNMKKAKANKQVLPVTKKALAKGALSQKLSYSVSPRTFNQQALRSARRAASDYPIITEAPAGEMKTYKRAGSNTYPSGGSAYLGNQSGRMEIVFASNNEVYMKDPICGYKTGAYVKGTLSGNTITVPLGQNLYYSSSYDAAVATCMVDLSGETIVLDKATEAITYTIDGETITQNGTSQAKALTCYWTDDDSWTGYSEWETVLTESAPIFVVTPPAELVTEAWTIARYFYDGEDETGEEKTLQIGFYPTESGTDVYVNGFSEFSDYLEGVAWIKGTLSADGKSITFAGNQYYGSYGANEYYFAGIDMTTFGLASSITVEYDAEAGTITWPETILLAENGAEDELSLYGYFTEFVATVKGTAPDPIAAPDIVTTEWYFKSQSLTTDDETGESVAEDYNLHVQVGIAGNDVFVKGLSEDLPDAWVKGTLDPETKKVTFATGQHFGTVSFWGYTFPYFFAGYGEKGLEDVVMAFDAETKTMTMESPTLLLINAAWLLLDPNLVLADVTMQEIQDVAATPAQPEIVASRLTGTSYPNISVEIPDLDAEGNPLLTSKLSYQYWTEIDGVQAPLTLDPAEYTELEAPMTEIPYNFSDDWDIYNYRLYLNQDFSTWKKIGIQSIYRGGDAESKSEISWKTIANFSVSPEFDSSKGGISVATKALEGEEVVVNVYPDNGYKVAKVTARVGKTNIKVDETEAKDGSIIYSVIAPPADVVVNAEFETTPADFSIDIAPGNINEAIETQLSGMQVRGLTLNLQPGDYTITKPIEAAGNLVINGNGAVIDAKDCVVTTGEGEEATSKAAPLIILPENNDVLEKSIINEREAYVIDKVTIKDVTINDIKASLIQSNNVYIVSKFLVDNALIKLNKTDNSDAILFMNPKGYIEDMEISNSTIYEVGTKNDYFFAQYKNRPGDYTKKQIQTIKNCTFYNVGSNKKFNNQAQKGQKWQTYDIENSIFYNSYMASGFCNGMVEQLNAGYTLKFSNNTYFKNGADNSVAESSIDKSETILTSDPKFEDAANGDFSVRNKTEQALNQTGDWNRWGEWIVDVYDINIDIAEDAHGTVKAPANAQEDELVTLEVVPEKGYRLVEGSLKVFLGKSELELDGNTFSMPAGNVKVTAQFEVATYAINIAEGIENGTVVADKQEALEGEEVTLTITPAEGYELDAISVTGVNTDVAVEVTDGKFKMPADAVTVNATFKLSTGINSVKANELENAVIYNMQGVRVEKAQAKGGVFIVNGRKVAIK